jgi:glucuronokinase
MRLIRKRAYARAGLIGNPSDGYGGKTIAMIVRNFHAEVVLHEWPDLEILWSQEDQSRFGSLRELVDDVRLHGYYGGVRLVKATIKRFVEHCDRQGIRLSGPNFSIRYQSNIPRQVGLAGSSAIIVATLRALSEYYGIDPGQLPRQVLPSLALSVERNELGIVAGLQDRVIQCYEGLVFMDFSAARLATVQGLECGLYEPLDVGLLPPLFLAYSHEASEPTEVTHGPLRARFERSDPAVLQAMREFAELTERFRDALIRRDGAQLGALMDRNFDVRRTICDLAPAHIAMIETARGVGASAKFAGSGGAIVGIYESETQYAQLQSALQRLGCEVLRPQVQAHSG